MVCLAKLEVVAMKCSKCNCEIQGAVIHVHTIVVDATYCPNCFISRHESPKS